MDGRLTAAAATARRHALFLALLGAGAALRVLASLAYVPALVFYDSVDYVQRTAHLAPGQLRPLGYSAFLWALPGDSLAVIPAAQHVMGLAIALLLYFLLLRLGVRPWVAALATVPVLLDAYQLVIEQYVLSETLFELLLVAGCAVLLWRRRPGLMGAGIAGVLFAGVALTRASGIVIVVPAVIALLCLGARVPATAPGGAGGRGRRLLRAAGAWVRGLGPALPAAGVLLAAFAVPLAGYAAWFHARHGQWAIANGGGRFLYARVAPFADCKRFSVPVEERILCPGQAVGHRPRLNGSTVSWYMWARFGDNSSPVYKLPDPESQRVLPGRFARRVILHQPWDYLDAVSHDFLRGFALTRTRGRDELPIARWQFQDHFPVYSRRTAEVIREHGGGEGRVRPGLARFLRGYQRAGFVPGPLLALCLVAGLLAALGVGRARNSGLRSASFLFAAMGFVVFASTVAVNQFTWRYQLPMLVLLSPAAAVGLTALVGGRGAAGESQAPTAGGYPASRQPAQPASSEVHAEGPRPGR